jgi:membrane protein implicated in regulation of membrane protease activity
LTSVGFEIIAPAYGSGNRSAIISAMSTRLLTAILSIIIEEGILVAVVLFGLPRIGVRLPLFVLIILAVAWVAVSALLYRAGTRALDRKIAVGAETLAGSRGRVVVPLEPEGMVKLGGELWRARCYERRIEKGEEVIVQRAEGTLLIVSPAE